MTTRKAQPEKQRQPQRMTTAENDNKKPKTNRRGGSGVVGVEFGLFAFLQYNGR
jgi:hypothetical protein